MKKSRSKRKKIIVKAKKHKSNSSSSLLLDTPIDQHTLNTPSESLSASPASVLYYSSQLHVFQEMEIDDKQKLVDFLQTIEKEYQENKQDFVWINICSFKSIDVIKELQSFMPLHPITFENLTDSTLRTKLEDFDNYLFLNLQTFYQVAQHEEKSQLFQSAKISLLVNKWMIITLQQEKHDAFSLQKKRLLTNFRKVTPIVRSDFILYFLLDGLVDQYFDLLEIIGEEIDRLSSLLFSAFNNDLIEQMYSFTQYLFLIRREIMPLSEVLLLLKNDLTLFDDEASNTYFGNVSDHLIKLIENLNFHRDSLTNLMNLYYSLSDQKLNQIMKTLTVVSTIFIPLTFIVGVYGMNFAKMPELEWQYGYLFVWILMISLSIGILSYMKKKKWL